MVGPRGGVADYFDDASVYASFAELVLVQSNSMKKKYSSSRLEFDGDLWHLL